MPLPNKDSLRLPWRITDYCNDRLNDGGRLTTRERIKGFAVVDSHERTVMQTDSLDTATAIIDTMNEKYDR